MTSHRDLESLLSLSNGNGFDPSPADAPDSQAARTGDEGVRLERLAQRSEELLEDLDHARGDVLSVSDLNRTLKQVLRNQVEILRALSAAPAPIVTVDVVTAPAPEADAESEEGEIPAEEAAPADPSSRSEALLGVTVTIMGARARQAVADFDHRDKDFERGLAKLKSWTEGGSGTPFQLRGDRAYLNVNGSSPEGVKSYEKNLMQRMGFARRLGRLDVEGLAGEVVLYERP